MSTPPAPGWLVSLCGRSRFPCYNFGLQIVAAVGAPSSAPPALARHRRHTRHRRFRPRRRRRGRPPPQSWVRLATTRMAPLEPTTPWEHPLRGDHVASRCGEASPREEHRCLCRCLIRPRLRGGGLPLSARGGRGGGGGDGHRRHAVAQISYHRVFPPLFLSPLPPPSPAARPAAGMTSGGGAAVATFAACSTISTAHQWGEG